MIEEILRKSFPTKPQEDSQKASSLHPFEIYAETYILERKNFKKSKLEITLSIIFALFGAAWGISWMEASAKAAIIFSEGLLREVFESLFKFGIVTTVGADGLWIMSTLSKNLGSKPSLGEKKTRPLSRFSRSVLSIILSLTSIIAPVYSAFKYNVGVGQLLAIIIFVVKFGYSLFGYSTLIHQASLFWKSRFSKEKNIDSTLKTKVLKNLGGLKENPSLLSEFPTGRAFVQYILLTIPDFSAAEAVISSLKKRVKRFIQTFIALSIGIATFMVDAFIITEALEKIFSIQSTLAFPLAIIAAMPTLVVMTLSSYRTLGEWLDTFFLKKKGDSVFEQYYPTLHKYTRLITFLISLLAPTAAAYITYDTLTGKIDGILVWAAMLFMIASRNLFAYFSLNQLFSRCVVFFARQGKTQKAKNLDQSFRLEVLIERIRSMNGNDFKTLLDGIHIPMHTKQELEENISQKK